MFSVYTVCFFGHRVIADFQSAESAVKRIIAEVIDKHEFVEFLVGREGDFDQIVTSTVIRYKKNNNAGNCSLTWVMPYMKADYTHNQESYDNYYDCVEVCEQSAQAHPKAAIQIRNRAMIDRSDEVYRNKLIVGDLSIDKTDTKVFFNKKEMQDNKIAQWTDVTKRRVQSAYFTFMTEAGLLKKDGKKWIITTPIHTVISISCPILTINSVKRT